MKELHFKIIFFIILSIYCLFFSQFGMENWDTGYIPSFSWRVVNGQNIYEDFIYKGPPITIYFHAFFMKVLPVAGQFFFIRISSYLLFATQVYFTISAFDNWYTFKNFGISKWALITICFILSVLNFPPYPWPTTDGLLFASIALWILSKNIKMGWLPMASVGFFIVIATFTKQSFYLIPIGFLSYFLVVYGFQKMLQFGLLLLFFFGLYISWISSYTSLSNYLEQTSNQTSFIDLYNSGISNYMHCFKSKWILLLVIFFPILPSFRFRKVYLAFIKNYLKWLLLGILVISIGFQLFQLERNASMQFFVICVLALVYYYFFIQNDIAFLAPIFLALLLAWSSAISVGSPYPIFYYTGMIVSFIVLFYKEIPKFKFDLILQKVVLLLLCLSSFASNRFPYRDGAIEDLTCDLGLISPKLKFIKTDQETYEKHLEMKQLVEKYGQHFIVAPNTPLANYIFDSQSELPADWIITNEVMGRESIFLKIAANKKNYIFIEKEYLEDKLYLNYMILYSQIATTIHEKFIEIDQTKHFIVYNSLQKNEKLP